MFPLVAPVVGESDRDYWKVLAAPYKDSPPKPVVGEFLVVVVVVAATGFLRQTALVGLEAAGQTEVSACCGWGRLVHLP